MTDKNTEISPIDGANARADRHDRVLSHMGPQATRVELPNKNTLSNPLTSETNTTVSPKDTAIRDALRGGIQGQVKPFPKSNKIR
ncbi:hypothetical protein BH10PAT1_BH10PAT1_2480 [soil metagenome]